MKGRRLRLTLQIVLLDLLLLQAITAHPSYRQQRCSNRLENALEHMRRRSFQVARARSLSVETPYSLYHSLYGQRDEADDVDQFYNGGRGYYAKNIHRNDYRTPVDVPSALSSGSDYPFAGATEQRQPHKLVVSGVEVEDLQVRLPQKAAARWVEVDKCKFSTENSTLDTRLIFPDLTLSGKIVLQPTGGRCNMILRLRHAGIEFRTIPIGFDTSANEESRRIGSASVRTDSHFAEPGFISVFAHGCQGRSGIRLRQNSKRRFGFTAANMADGASGTSGDSPLAPAIELSEPHVVLGTSQAHRLGKLHHPFQQHPLYDIRSDGYTKDNVKKRNWDHESHVDARNYYEPTESDSFYRPRHYRYRRSNRPRQYRALGPPTMYDEMNFSDDILNITDDLQDLVQPDARAFAELFGGGGGGPTAGGNHDDLVSDALSSELEKVFSMGVRGLLTTYMQRALQPAIKETLMENMGYTLSYG